MKDRALEHIQGSDGNGSAEGGSFFMPEAMLSERTLRDFGFPIRSYEGRVGSVDQLIGIGYEAFEHSCEQEQYRAISRTSKLILGPELNRDEARLAIYFGNFDHTGNDAVGWESARLSAKSNKRIGMAWKLGYPEGEARYSHLLHAPYLTDSDHPLFLAATIEASLEEDGKLVVIGPADLTGREEVVELSKRSALAALAEKHTGRRLVRLGRRDVHGTEPGLPAVGPGRKYTKQRISEFRNPRWWGWHHLRNRLVKIRDSG